MRRLTCLAIFFLLLSCSRKEELLFKRMDASATGITFANRLHETEELNILTYEYFYNGGGVAAGDFNNDNLVDLYFTGNQVENKLYLNQGRFKFEDITAKTGVAGRKDSWKTGVSLVDINADGWLDIYVCYSGNLPLELRENQLFINNRNLTFTEQAKAYGLADAGYSTQAAFLDYDLDGDLDCFLVNHNLKDYERNPDASAMRTKRDEYAGDKLFRNDNGRFKEVTQTAGIKSNPLGFGLGLAVADVNVDGLPDIYVGNDYVEDDYLYVNQGNGTFKDTLREMLSHTSRFTMGVDIADVNNDARPDIFTLDMLPEDNTRQKLLAFPDNWNNYQSMLANGFHHQNMRNMLHINNGVVGFSEIGQLAGVSNTDWSWAALFADFDNDGWKDLFVTNGEIKDFTSSDFIKYTADEQMKAAAGQPHESLLEQIRKMPSSPTHNYIFKNNGNLTFTDKTTDWGFGKPTVANGAVYVDLDNDGDLDLVTNNNNEAAGIYKNNILENSISGKPQTSFLKIRLKGPASNPFGVQAKVFVECGGLRQYREFSPVRGFQSSIVDALHFGLGKGVHPAKIRVVWSDGKTQTVDNVKTNRMLVLDYRNASLPPAENISARSIFQADPDTPGFAHKENYTNDFTRQILLPYQYSYTGARMATGDVNADGLIDLYVGGARNQPGKIFLQRQNSIFPEVRTPAFQVDSVYEDKDAVFFDADGDKDLDLYVVSGDYSQPKNSVFQQDRLYENNGKGSFTRDKAALPDEFLNGSCVKPFDVDRDGDLDLFVGGTVVPGEFPRSEPSLFLINNGEGKFSTGHSLALGLVSDAVVLDRNGSPNLVVVGEWMPPKIVSFQNAKPAIADLPVRDAGGRFRTLNGWWNRIAAGDLDGDGDQDLVLGNLGGNCQMKPSETEPIRIAAADFDGNGTLDPVLSYYMAHQQHPAVSRDELLEQIVSLRRQYTDYQSFATATMEDLFPGNALKNATTYRIDFTETCILENAPAGFVLHSLPLPAQYAPVYAIAIHDFDGDGKKDLLLCGNQSQYHLRIGRMDANHGFLFRNKGGFHFEYVPQNISGLHLDGDVKDISAVNADMWIFSVNNGPVQAYRINKPTAIVP